MEIKKFLDIHWPSWNLQEKWKDFSSMEEVWREAEAADILTVARMDILSLRERMKIAKFCVVGRVISHLPTKARALLRIAISRWTGGVVKKRELWAANEIVAQIRGTEEEFSLTHYGLLKEAETRSAYTLVAHATRPTSRGLKMIPHCCADFMGFLNKDHYLKGVFEEENAQAAWIRENIRPRF